jgi:GcrA cell cycle regulator
MWNDVNVALLKKLWTEGQSAGQIAGRLGCSRSAICAKLQRLGLKRGRKPPTAKPTIVSRPRHRAISRAKAKTPGRSDVLEPELNSSFKSLSRDRDLSLRPLHRVIPERQSTGHPIEFSKAQLRAMLVEAVRNTV